MSDTDDPNDALIILGDPLENPIPTIQLLLNGKFGLGGGAQFGCEQYLDISYPRHVELTVGLLRHWVFVQLLVRVFGSRYLSCWPLVTQKADGPGLPVSSFGRTRAMRHASAVFDYLADGRQVYRDQPDERQALYGELLQITLDVVSEDEALLRDREQGRFVMSP